MSLPLSTAWRVCCPHRLLVLKCHTAGFTQYEAISQWLPPGSHVHSNFFFNLSPLQIRLCFMLIKFLLHCHPPCPQVPPLLLSCSLQKGCECEWVCICICLSLFLYIIKHGVTVSAGTLTHPVAWGTHSWNCSKFHLTSRNNCPVFWSTWGFGNQLCNQRASDKTAPQSMTDPGCAILWTAVAWTILVLSWVLYIGFSHFANFG